MARLQGSGKNHASNRPREMEHSPCWLCKHTGRRADWGVDARKDQATGVDAACGLSLVKNLPTFKSRLNELHHQATEPPVLGVEIEAYSVDGYPDVGL